MAPESNWLSFSLSSMEASQPHQMFQASEDNDTQHYNYFSDNTFYSNGWASTNQVNKSIAPQSTTSDEDTKMGIMFQFDPYIQHHQSPPKLEDFLGGDTELTSLVGYSDHSQTDSSLTHSIYDHGPTESYFNDHNGFQAFPSNSCSQVDDSAKTTQIISTVEFVSHSIESVTDELAYSQCPPTTTTTTEKPIVPAPAPALKTSQSCKKSIDTFGQRTSIYRGVTRHRWTGRYEAHLWDNSCRREGQARKGRQVYLGGYDKEDKAARAYDLAALKYWGSTSTTNFPISNYTQEIEDMKHMTKQEFIASLRRRSSGFSRGASIYRGVTRHHQQGRWQARIGRVAGNKDLYLGTFSTEEEAAEAYDIAAIKFRGMNAVTNFEMSRYDVETIMKSSLPIGGAAKKLKLALEDEHKPTQCTTPSTTFSPFDTTPYYHYNLFQQPDTSMVPSQPELFIWPNQSY